MERRLTGDAHQQLNIYPDAAHALRLTCSGDAPFPLSPHELAYSSRNMLSELLPEKSFPCDTVTAVTSIADTLVQWYEFLFMHLEVDAYIQWACETVPKLAAPLRV